MIDLLLPIPKLIGRLEGLQWYSLATPTQLVRYCGWGRLSIAKPERLCVKNSDNSKIRSSSNYYKGNFHHGNLLKTVQFIEYSLFTPTCVIAFGNWVSILRLGTKCCDRVERFQVIRFIVREQRENLACAGYGQRRVRIAFYAHFSLDWGSCGYSILCIHTLEVLNSWLVIVLIVWRVMVCEFLKLDYPLNMKLNFVKKSKGELLFLPICWQELVIVWSGYFLISSTNSHEIVVTL